MANKLDMLIKRESSRRGLFVDIDDVQAVNWNKDLIELYAHELKDRVIPTFGSYIKYVEECSIRNLTNSELTVLFDKYYLYCGYNHGLYRYKYMRSYVDVLNYCDSEFARYTDNSRAHGSTRILYNDSIISNSFNVGVVQTKSDDDIPDYIRNAWAVIGKSN